MASLFLSYSRKDLDRVGRIVAALERDGHAIWWDRRLAGGQSFADEIEQALERADVVVVCWSRSSLRSDWVRDEAAVGRDRGRLVPISLDGCLPPLGFRQYHAIDLSSWTDGADHARALQPLRQAVAAVAAGTPPVTAADPVATSTAGAPRRRAIAAVSASAVLAVALMVARITGASGGIEAKVAVGTIELTSAGLPRPLAALLAHEMAAAFGAENAVTVIAPGEPVRAAATPFVMDGTISRIGAGARFTINLKDRKSGVLLWSGSYDHESADAIAARQAAVNATQIVRCGLWGASSYPGRMSHQSLSLYLKWCDEHWSGSAGATAQMDAARRVTVVLPDFSFGWSALALATGPLVAAQGPDSRSLLRIGREAARRSMELDSQNPEGYMALASLMPLDRFAEREQLLRKALTVRPTECGCEREAYGDFLASVGRMEEAVEQFQRARDMRPLAPFSNLRLAQALYLVGRNEEGDKVLAAARALWPDATSLRLLTIKASLWNQRYDEAVAHLSHPDLPLTSDQRRTLSNAFALLESGRRSGSDATVAGLRALAADPRTNDKILVAMLAALGEHDAAIQAARSLIDARGLLEAEILFEPHMVKAAGEAAYADLVAQLGLVDYWRSAPGKPDICKAGTLPRLCGTR